MTKKNLILIMIDGGRLDYALNSQIFSNIKSNSIFLSQSITYGPHTIAAMHAVFSGCFGSRTGRRPLPDRVLRFYPELPPHSGTTRVGRPRSQTPRDVKERTMETDGGSGAR